MEQATEKQIGFAKKLGIRDPQMFDKQALRGLIDVELKKQKPEEKVPEGRQSNVKRAYEEGKSTTMYVSYAKDIFCALNENDNTTTRSELMKQAIELVKQARGEFE